LTACASTTIVWRTAICARKERIVQALSRATRRRRGALSQRRIGTVDAAGGNSVGLQANGECRIVGLSPRRRRGQNRSAIAPIVTNSVLIGSLYRLGAPAARRFVPSAARCSACGGAMYERAILRMSVHHGLWRAIAAFACACDPDIDAELWAGPEIASDQKSGPGVLGVRWGQFGVVALVGNTQRQRQHSDSDRPSCPQVTSFKILGKSSHPSGAPGSSCQERSQP
jgi:hypothetical protein